MNNNNKFVIKIDEYKGTSPRIIGFRKLKEAGLTIPEPIFVLTKEAFLKYKKFGMIDSLKKQISDAFLKIKEKNRKKGVIVRRAYVVPGIESPPGPRSSSTTSSSVTIKEVEKVFDFAINNKFDIDGSEISVFMHPHINPKIPSGGGCVTGEGHRDIKGILIEVIYGNDEGVQSFPHDDYLLDYKKNRFIQKIIHYKNKCLSAINQLEYKTLPVPRKLRNVQVLDDDIVLKIGRDYRKFAKLFGYHRLEFDVLSTGTFYIEATPYKKKDITGSMIQFSGKVITVKNNKDVSHIQAGNKLIFVDPKVIKARNMDLLTYLACNLPEARVILYPGSTSTAHASVIFREMGHTIVYVGYEIFHNGEEVVVQIEDGELVVHRQFLI